MKLSGAAIISLATPAQVSADTVAVIGGIDLTGAPPYAALVSSSGEIIPLTITGLPALHGIINSVAINNSGNGIIGGRDTTGPIYAALVPSSGNPLVPLTFPPEVAAGGIINSVAINDSGNSLVGGKAFFDAQPAYLAAVSSSGVVTSLTLTGGIATTGQISSVSINSAGNGLVGGQDLTGSQPAYAALVSSSGAVTPLALTGGIATTGQITSVSINGSGSGMIGGQDLTGSQPAYAARVSSSGAVAPLVLTGGMTTNGVINHVAINSSGNSIIGGQDLTGSQPAYAALVSSSGVVTPLALGSRMDTNGNITSVAINSAGNGIMGGQDFTGPQPAYAALFTSSGTVIPLTFTGGMAVNGWINSVAWMESALPLFTRIPTTSLSGHNLIFAEYINAFAPENAFYFIPAELDGTLNAALQSAASTRNGISIYTASNNLFFLTTSFANHIRHQQTEGLAQHNQATPVATNALPYDELLASLSLQKKETTASQDKPISVWFETIGAWDYQKPQHQTAGFNPTTGGVILACDSLITPQWRIGGGISYLFTHIHEQEGQGHSNINQEDAFVYSSWDNQ